MKKFILPIILILGIISVLILVSAVQMSKQIENYGTMSGEFVEIGYYNFEKGWNLVQGFPSPDWLSGGEVEASNIKAIYGFDPVSQKYIRFYPNANNAELSSSDLRIDTMIATSAFWVYSDKSGESEFMTLKPAPVNKKMLLKGWNFIAITPDMTESFAGNCNIEKAYIWGNWNKQWIIFPYSNPRSFTWDGGNVFGYGLVIKVSADCRLGTPEEDVPGVPTLP